MKYEIEIPGLPGTDDGFIERDRNEPPCIECGAEDIKEAEKLCICNGDKDYCHGQELWP